MAAAATTPGERLRSLALSEFRLLLRELSAARRGKDGGVHRARKCLQRLRALVRLLAPGNVEWARREDALLRRLRRRFGKLRDAAVRVELVDKLARLDFPDEERERVKAALARLRQARKAAWASHPEDAAFWANVEKEATRLQKRLSHWPFDKASDKRFGRALERARLRLRQALKQGLGRIERGHRHDLRRRLRRLAALRKAASYCLRRRDPGATALTALAKEMGSEGDLWLAATALRSSAPAAETRELRRLLEKERKAACRRHDGELASARRRLLAKPVVRREAATKVG